MKVSAPISILFLSCALSILPAAQGDEEYEVEGPIIGPGRYIVSSDDAGAFGECDFLLEMDINGKGDGVVGADSRKPWAYMIRRCAHIGSDNCVGLHVGISNDNSLNFKTGSLADRLLCYPPDVNFVSTETKHWKVYRSGNTIGMDIDGYVCNKTEVNPQLHGVTGQPLVFGGHPGGPGIRETNLDMSNIKFTTTCTDHFVAEAGASGDPHFVSWSGLKYEFHGVCDLVLVENKGFQSGLGMDIHIRTKSINQFAYISSVVLKVGKETLEVIGDSEKDIYWKNNHPMGRPKDGIVGLISGYPISYKKVNSKKQEFIVDLGDGAVIVMSTFKKFVHVGVRGATKEKFGTSRGLLGTFGAGKLQGRNNEIIENKNEFGLEWQVRPSEGILFHNAEGPQAPERCAIPEASNLRRRLAETKISEEEAHIICAKVNPEVYEMCIFDVMATGDKEVVGAY